MKDTVEDISFEEVSEVQETPSNKEKNSRQVRGSLVLSDNSLEFVKSNPDVGQTIYEYLNIKTNLQDRLNKLNEELKGDLIFERLKKSSSPDKESEIKALIEELLVANLVLEPTDDSPNQS